MAQRGIREVDGKRILSKYIDNYTSIPLGLPDSIILITPETDTSKLFEKQHFLRHRLVAKPDQLIGKRGKNKLILLNADFKQCLDFIREKGSNEITIGKTKGMLTDFLIEPYVRHDTEYYVAIKTERDHDSIFFSEKGGIDIEENWDKVIEIKIPVPEKIDKITVKTHIPKTEHQDLIAEFITALYKLFVDFDFTYLEINPFTILNNKIIPLDLVAKLDDTAGFKNHDKWGSIEFPMPFGTSLTAEESYIKSMDEKTGASLKLTILNTKGRIWTMVAGGGASVIYADTIVDLGFKEELANYGEYSGNPNTEETYEYAKTILDLMTREKDENEKPKFLIIGGGIANFTDVAKTFKGIVMAIEDYKADLKKIDARIYVRRGGPNYEQGLKIMRDLGERIGIPVFVYGPETHMTRIVKMALEEK